VRPLLVVVADVLAEHPLEVPSTKDEHPVQTLRPHGLDPPLGMGVRLRRPDRRAQDLPTLAAEHLVEGASELGVVVAEQKPDRHAPIAQSTAAFLACWVTHAESGLAVTPGPGGDDPPGAELEEEQHVEVLRRIVATVNKSHATIPSARARRNCAQVGPSRRGAGPRPCRRSSVLMVVAPTRMPSLRSSPQIRMQPHRAFSLAIRRTSSTVWGSIGGLPGVRPFA
jgi:hypothetical protein